MNIGIDIDLTLVDSGKGWENWLKKHFPQTKVIPNKNINYNLSEYFGESSTGLKHFDYWSNNHLYDDMDFEEGAYSSLKNLKEKGFNLIFISHTKSGHFKSKFRLLKKLDFLDFSNGDAFIATKEKGTLSGCLAAMVDDRNKFLNQFEDEVIKIKFDTLYSQEEEPRVQYDLVSRNWTEIADFILETV